MEKKLSVSSSTLDMTVNEVVLDTAMANKRVLAIVLATKPCFYKLYSVMREAKKQHLPFFILHTGQHYDDLVGHGYHEFGFKEHEGVNLELRGDLTQKSAEIFLKINTLWSYLKKKYPGTTVIPYVNGDTLVAGLLPAAVMMAARTKSVHGEAGLRGMYPQSFENFNFKISPEIAWETLTKQWHAPWNQCRLEPYPEQYDTYVGSAASEYFFAPTNLNRDHLIREGYPQKNIFVIGNTVSDIIHTKNTKAQSVFETYPKLEEGEWLRVDIHRRENLTKDRFAAIIGAAESLVKGGQNVVFVELTATKNALEYYGLRQKLLTLEKSHPNFLFTPLWKEYSHVTEFLRSPYCQAILTDSGSMQEEMHILQKPCLTARFSTDRPETIMNAHSNLLIPPTSAGAMATLVRSALSHTDQFSYSPSLYGTNVAKKIIAQTKKLFSDGNFFPYLQNHLGLTKDTTEGPAYN